MFTRNLAKFRPLISCHPKNITFKLVGKSQGKVNILQKIKTAKPKRLDHTLTKQSINSLKYTQVKDSEKEQIKEDINNLMD
jgi:hypothetical protein